MNLRRILFVFFASIYFFGAFSGCGKKVKSKATSTFDEKVTLSEEAKVPLVGSLEQNILNIQSDVDVDACDIQWKENQLKIAKILDSKESEISEFEINTPPNPDSNYYRRVELKPTYLRKVLHTEPTQKGWQTYTENWNQVFRRFHEIKDQPINTNWIRLNADFRSMITNDRNRVVYASNSELDHESGPIIEALLTDVKECQEQITCQSYSPEKELIKKTINNSRYQAYFSLLEQIKNTDSFRPLVEQFVKRLERDLEEYQFIRNPQVVRANKNTIQLPLDPTVFSESINELTKIIESVWSSDKLNLNIIWKPNGTEPNLYKIILGQEIGERAYVRRDEHFIKLFPNVRDKSIAHEVGHVLGFQDHYYTVWQKDTCTYEVQYREDDLMSESETGSVTEEEWNDLNQHYPKPTK